MAERRSFLLWLGHAVEGALLLCVWTFLSLLPVAWSSALIGGLARLIGPHLPVSRIARRNLSRAFNFNGNPQALNATVRAMWDNLGRVAGEMPHLYRVRIFDDPRIAVEGVEYLDRLRDDGRPGLFFTAHIANWELTAMSGIQRGLTLGVVYRAANNPLVDRLIHRGRGALMGELLPKGREGAKRALALLDQGGHVGILPDQKMNDGIAVPFFGRPAMTAPALAQFALKYDCPIVPVHAVREGGFRFRIVVEPPLDIRPTGDRARDVAAITTEVNRIMEGWIRAQPGQWMWLHRRWPD